MSIPKWTEDRATALSAFVGGDSPVTQDVVAEAAEHFETSARSVSSKLRKMGFDVELASAGNVKAFSDAQAEVLSTFVVDNSGMYTYAEVSQYFEDGAFSPKQIQGKVLSMELTGHIKAAPAKESVKTYSDAEEAEFIALATNGGSIEAIAEALDRPVNSIRGKALSLLRAGTITAIPRQESTKTSAKVDPLAAVADVATMTVEEIAEVIGKTVRGVKTMLTRRGLSASDYDGASKKEKAAQ